jgi:N-formylglutamate amidohydrolase
MSASCTPFIPFRFEQAIESWQLAADSALRKAAFVESQQQAEHALGLLAHIRDGESNNRLRLDLLTTIGTVQFNTLGLSAPAVEATFRELGYVVSRNKPYAGGFITEHYGNPAAGLHAIQLELNRALYMDERRFERASTFDRLAADLETLAENLAAIPLQELRPYRAAAE